MVVLAVVISSTGVGVGVTIGVAAIALSTFGVVCFVVARSVGAHQQQRQEATEEFAATHALAARAARDTADLKREFRMLPEIKHGGSIRRAFEGFIAGRRFVLFEHVYMVHTGSAAVPVIRTIYAVETPRWPRVEVSPNRGLRRLIPQSFGRARLELDLPEFNRRMRVKAADPDFALTLLSPELQRHILSRPIGTWRLIEGWICLIEQGSLRLDRATRGIAHLQRFLELLPQELEYWPTDEL